MTAIYSIMHLLVDGVCALAMFGSFLNRENGYFYILVYNFCAFALQMPFGVLLDILGEGVSEKRRFGKGRLEKEALAFLTASAGALCTIAGAFTHPVLLGIGNALFHVGGGIGCIRQDHERGWQGRGLGVFVAPGALGLYLGTLLGSQGDWKGWYAGAGAGMLILCASAGYCVKHRNPGTEGPGAEASEFGNRGFGYFEPGNREAWNREVHQKRNFYGVIIGCFLVVILRSYIGMAVSFPWKTGTVAGILAILALVLGKAAGGFAAAGLGVRKTVVFSLGLAAVCYLFSPVMPAGLAAVFLFNMTMPVTLYQLVCRMPRMPGFAFGFLTFALFLGFLPGYFGMLPSTGGKEIGCAGCILSLLLLLGVTGGSRS